VRRIPIAFAPVPGESLDGWLIAYAARLDTTLADLADAIAMGTPLTAKRLSLEDAVVD
jgi:hypothetical protein